MILPSVNLRMQEVLPLRRENCSGMPETEDFPVRTTSSALAYRAKLC